ncbi:MAG: ABC transporter substrate-binding protein [Candidatus Promineifilaceae bacterium]
MRQIGLQMVMALAFVLLIVACSQDNGSTSEALSPPPTETVTAANRSETQGKMPDAAQPEATADRAEAQDVAVESSVEEATVTPEPGRTITVCLPGEINDLYLYGDQSAAAAAVRRALYEAPFTTTGYSYQAQALEKVPSLAEGDAQRVVVKVEEGDRVVDASGKVANLRKGVRVVDATGEIVEFDNEPLWMEQLEVEFIFKPLDWSDGTPVTAADSVFSFEVAADPASSTGKEKSNFTAGYEALGERKIKWTGLPGYLDPTYMTNVWTPLPAHLYGELTAAQLGKADEALQPQVTSGPYVVSEWREANEIHLARNHAYYRAEEGLPKIANVIVRLGTVDSFLDGTVECDVVAGEAIGPHNLADLKAAGALDGWELLTAPGNVIEQVTFGVNPVSDYGDRRPDWFEDARVRQAIALCTDRDQMVSELTEGNGVIVNTLVPDGHPLTPAGLQPWTYDPSAANALLDEAGYLDFAADGRRQDVRSGVPMTITLGTNSESQLRKRITEMVVDDLAQCGIPVVSYDRPAGTWFGAGPEGPIFGRQFDLAELAWVAHAVPDCAAFSANNVPGPETSGFAGWSAPNISGWTNEAYDAACAAAERALPGGDGYVESMNEVLRIFNEELPVLPLFTNYDVVAVRPGVSNLQPDATELSVFWNIAEWEIEE